jgi:hypothetical protein
MLTWHEENCVYREDLESMFFLPNTNGYMYGRINNTVHNNSVHVELDVSWQIISLNWASNNTLLENTNSETNRNIHFPLFFHAVSSDDDYLPGCESTDWSFWSPCGVTCGKGISMRTRNFMNADKAAMLGCDRQMVQKEMCSAKGGVVCHGEMIKVNLNFRDRLQLTLVFHIRSPKARNVWARLVFSWLTPMTGVTLHWAKALHCMGDVGCVDWRFT